MMNPRPVPELGDREARRRAELIEIPPSELRTSENPSYQAYKLLYVTYSVAPFVAGLDKYFHVLADWRAYLAPFFPNLVNLSPHTFMHVVGGVEMAAAIGVAAKPRIFAYVVAGWLGGIVVNLLVLQKYYDIALRDFGLAMGALALAKLASRFDKKGQAIPL